MGHYSVSWQKVYPMNLMATCNTNAGFINTLDNFPGPVPSTSHVPAQLQPKQIIQQLTPLLLPPLFKIAWFQQTVSPTCPPPHTHSLSASSAFLNAKWKSFPLFSSQETAIISLHTYSSFLISFSRHLKMSPSVRLSARTSKTSGLWRSQPPMAEPFSLGTL